MDGTKCAVVTECRRTASAMALGSRCAPGAIRCRVAPVISGQKNSHTDTSKVNGVFCRTLSSAPRRYSSCIHSSRLTMPRCGTATPLGRPVEPDVKIT